MAFIFGLAFSPLSFAKIEWSALTTEKNPDCEVAECFVKEEQVQFQVTFKTEAKLNLTNLKQIEIKNLNSGRVQSIPLGEVNGLGGNGAYFKVYKISLRGGNLLDLAIHAYNSARAGPTYYYFIYDKVHQQFVVSDTTVPKLVFDPKTKHFLAGIQEVPYKIDEHLKLVEVMEK
jgi:hypothetical protein